MERSDFLKKLGICAIIAPFVPKMLAEMSPKEEETTYTKGILAHLTEKNKTYYTSAYSLADFDEVFEQSISLYQQELLEQIDRNLWRCL